MSAAVEVVRLAQQSQVHNTRHHVHGLRLRRLRRLLRRLLSRKRRQLCLHLLQQVVAAVELSIERLLLVSKRLSYLVNTRHRLNRRHAACRASCQE